MEELMKWLEFNRERLETYSPQEIADMAIACGMERSAVATWVTRERFRNVA